MATGQKEDWQKDELNMAMLNVMEIALQIRELLEADAEETEGK